MSGKLITIKRDLGKCEMLRFPVTEARTFNDKVGTLEEQITIYARAITEDIPDNIWMDMNQKIRNLDTGLVKKIEESLILSTKDNFHLLNGGIIISAHHARVVAIGEQKYLEIFLKDQYNHGIIDGGLTYEIIKKNKKLITFKKRISIQVITGIEDYTDQLLDARNNTSNSPLRSSIGLDEKLDVIRETLIGTPYYKNIAFNDNPNGKIDVVDIIAILSMFNIDKYKGNVQPIESYESNKKCVDLYLSSYYQGKNNPYVKMKSIMIDIFTLVNHIEGHCAKAYSKLGGDYGKVIGVASSILGKKFDRLFGQPGQKIDFNSPKGFLYPIIGAFRALIKEEDGVYKWREDPIKVFNEIGPQMIQSTINTSKALGDDPNATGKFIGTWEGLYSAVKLYYLENN